MGFSRQEYWSGLPLPSPSNCLLISWLQSPPTVILEPKKIKSVTVSVISPSISHEVMGPDAMILFFECWILSQHSNVQGGLLMTAILRPFTGVGLAEIPSTVDFQEANSKGKISAHPLRYKQNNTNPKSLPQSKMFCIPNYCRNANQK